MNRRGLAMIEALLSLGLLSFISLASIEVFSSGRHVFFRLGIAQEKDERALAGLDRVRADLSEAGLGLSGPAGLGLIQGLAANEESFVIYSLEKELPLSADAAAGETFLSLADCRDLAAGREVCVFAPDHAERAIIASVQTGGIEIGSPLVARLPRQRHGPSIDPDGRDPLGPRRADPAAAGQRRLGPAADRRSGRLRLPIRRRDKACRMEIYLVGSEEAPYAATVFAKNLALAGQYP